MLGSQNTPIYINVKGSAKRSRRECGEEEEEEEEEGTERKKQRKEEHSRKKQMLEAIDLASKIEGLIGMVSEDTRENVKGMLSRSVTEMVEYLGELTKREKKKEEEEEEEEEDDD